jgi:hypothetical protein
MPRPGMLDNPAYSGLFENPSPYSMDSLKAFGIASAGVGLGLLVARGIDRFVATMKPATSKNGTTSNLAWYGKNAVAAINRRPGLVRLGVQAGGAVVAIGGAYALRNKPVAPWLLGGIALGFGSNLLLQAFEWYAIPYLLKIKKPDEKTIQNRLYVLEQTDTQDSVDAICEDWRPSLPSGEPGRPGRGHHPRAWRQRRQCRTSPRSVASRLGLAPAWSAHPASSSPTVASGTAASAAAQAGTTPVAASARPATVGAPAPTPWSPATTSPRSSGTAPRSSGPSPV